MCEDMDRVRINLKVKGRVRFSVRNSFTKFPFLCYMVASIRPLSPFLPRVTVMRRDFLATLIGHRV